ncbi:protein ENHANCED PSEUDOMONAS SUSCEPTIBILTY 1-like [Papaver somniferum]|uniref:protein ENHANCED PSEUDOMONAS SUSCEPTIBILTY 1-like n=1 Tax=Papaver somniferum TaxID=3469 RepID=UPI000E704EFE|nr:protein ENHANCED PSEUDOMONAS SUSCEPTIBILTY 1-like [Papaver somniferum]
MSFPSVRRVSTTNVRPASYTDRDEFDDNHKRIDLNPWDLTHLRQLYMQRGLLFQKWEQAEEETAKEVTDNMITRLKTSLSFTLDYFFPLAGRLGIQKHENDGTVSFYIDCNFEGVEFIHVTAEITVEDILSPTYTPQSLIDSLFSLNEVKSYEGRTHPLLSIQVNELLDGSIFIACSLNHLVSDGTSFWHFINSWSEISRSSSGSCHNPGHPPVFERWFLNDADSPIRLSFTSDDEILLGMKRSSSPPHGLVEKCFRFTKTNIAILKATANSEMISGAKQNAAISSLQAVLAHVWVAVTKVRMDLDGLFLG